LSLAQPGANFGVKFMEQNGGWTDADDEKRKEVITMLLPVYGRNTAELLEAATSVQEYLKGMPPGRLSGTADKE